jgi:hypothetical protein
MAQWQGAYAGNTHETKVAEAEQSLRLAVTALGASGELERASRMLAVARLALRVYQARLKALESKIARDSEPRPGGDPTEGFRRHQRRLELLLAGGPERIAQEFGVNLSADVSLSDRGDAG